MTRKTEFMKGLLLLLLLLLLQNTTNDTKDVVDIGHCTGPVRFGIRSLRPSMKFGVIFCRCHLNAK